MSWIKRAWKGEERLWKVFWIYGVLLGFVLQIAPIAILYVFGSVAHLLSVGVETIYVISVFVAEWRCAFNTGWRFWGYVVRALIGFYVIGVAGSVLVINEMGIREVIAATECNQDLKEYSERGGANLKAFRQICIQNHLRDITPLISNFDTNVKTDTGTTIDDQQQGISETSDAALKTLTAPDRLNTYFVAQYIRSREGYVPDALVEDFDMVRLMTAPGVYHDFVTAQSSDNPNSNIARLGHNGTRWIEFRSLVFLKPQLAEVHFTINEKSSNEAFSIQYNKVARIDFEYVKMNLKANERFINPAGFRVFQYHLDDDSVHQ